ncbi:MAG: YdcF family protein [Ruminococcaceae bacterium]|nr:YdcF family protein [Oscillospiraceae bacterium]MBQ4131475.1 YdcF family protein [Clostridia bacterium]
MLYLNKGGGIVHKIGKKKTFRLISLFLVLSILFYLIFTAISIVSYGKTDGKANSDVAIVLGAGTSNGEVSPVYRERINHGIWLYENDYVDYLILTGGIGEGNNASDAYIAKQYALSKSVPEQAIFIEEKSTITEENLENAKAIMDENSFDTAIIVSDPLHMKRAMLMAGDYGIDACSSPTPTTMYRSFKTKIPFLAREEFFYIGYSIVRVFR